jgi:TatD DNase family protein
MMLVDSHCHLDDERFDADRQAVIERALAAGVEMILAIGSGPPDLEAAIRLAEEHPHIYATVGVHPHDASKWTPNLLERLRELASRPKVVAIGEIGLDYHYNFSPPEAQRQVFGAQLALARELGKPVVIHTREAWEDTFRILGNRASGIMHCFSGGAAEARACVELGMHISFAGIVTYPKAAAVQEAAKATPWERLLVETDAPYLAPVPHRGKRNEPAFVRETAAKIAELKGVRLETVAEFTTANFRELCLQAAASKG